MNTIFPVGVDTDSDDPYTYSIGIKLIWGSEEVSQFSRQTMIAGFSVWFLFDFLVFALHALLYLILVTTFNFL